MLDTHRYQNLIAGQASYWLFVLCCCVFIVIGAYCALSVEHVGHIITGMNNHVVWGLPHVFAVSLIVSASGALNAASFSSVFNNPIYKPFARFSVVLAISLLIGGLLVLVLDLGRPDRLIVAMTTYNFRSIFTWNIFLYTGFVAIGIGYLWMMMEPRFHRHINTAGRLALVWRIVLTSGTGSIFGFLVGRNALDTALLAPLFIALSLVMGTAAFSLMLALLQKWRGSMLNDSLIGSLSRFLIWFLLALVYFSMVHHITNLYISEHWFVERHTLLGDFALLFWGGHILLGVVAPIVLLWVNKIDFVPLARLLISSLLALLGGAALLYVIIIGSQSTPQVLFPGKTVLSSSFGDAGFNAYQPSKWEWGLGFGGVFFALLLCLIVLRVLPLLPEAAALSDRQTDSDKSNSNNFNAPGSKQGTPENSGS